MTTNFLSNVAAPQIYAHTLRLLDLWKMKAMLAPGCPFDASDDLVESSLDSIWAVTFGTDIGAIQSKIDSLRTAAPPVLPRTKADPAIFASTKLPAAFHSILYLCHGIGVAMQSIHPRLRHWVLRQTSLYKSAAAHKDLLIHDALVEAKIRSQANGMTTGGTTMLSAIDHLVRQQERVAGKEQRSTVYDSPTNRDELFGFIIAGHDTTSTTLMWCLKMLSDNPRTQEKLRKELQAAFQEEVRVDAIPNFRQVANSRIPFLDATVQEIFRLSQTQPGAIREAKVDTVVLGHAIPSGTNVFLMSNGGGYVKPDCFSNQIDEKLRGKTSVDSKRKKGSWDNSNIEQFMPERWIRVQDGIEVFDANAGPIQAFGGGVRECFGKRLAYLQMKMILTIIILKIDLSKTPTALSSYSAIDGLTHKPKQCFICPKLIQAQSRSSLVV
ncbi:cytochrome P450 [Elsinoe ampelina]|uniref:Cytochrome P450 n=1 Tax=Elsinoe ampelina TaxID=302913 RepID=A0A6A6GSI5_9PEZI|nr:cytochrome P450 [Elsinoe ampelina]